MKGMGRDMTETVLNEDRTLYFPRKERKKLIAERLSNAMEFEHRFSFGRDIYLENSACLIVISNHFVRVHVFNGDNDCGISDIKNILNAHRRTWHKLALFH